MKYPSTNITFGGMEDGGLTVKVKDSSNPKTKWIVWKADKENPNQDSEAFADLQRVKFGEVIGVTYGEKEKSFTGREGNTITYTERTIYKVLPPVAQPAPQPHQVSSQAKTSPSVSNTASQSKSDAQSDDNYWDKKAYKQCLWNYWLALNTPEKLGRTQNAKLSDIEMDSVWIVFKQIEADADRRFSPLAQAVQKTNPDFFKQDEQLPIINQDEEMPPIETYDENEVSVEDVPF
jgi:hypothetical protein